MSRQAQRVRKLAATLSERTGVEVQAEYDYDRHWRLSWVDGPTAEAMRAAAKAATRHLPQLDVAELRWRREHTELAVVAAALAYLREHPAERHGLRHRGDTLHGVVEYPERLDAALLAQAQYALARTADKRGWPDSTAALGYLERAGVVGVAADLWLSTLRGGESGHPPSDQGSSGTAVPPAVSADMLDPELRTKVDKLVDTLVNDIAGPADGEGPRGLRRMWSAEQARHLLLDEVDRRQRHDAAIEVADGAGLRGLSHHLGLDRSALRKRWPDLHQRDVPQLRWLHDHADEWRAAISALTDSVGHEAGVPLDRDQRSAALVLEHRATDGTWRSLIGTPEIVRGLLAGLHRSRDGLTEVLDRLETLLAAYDVLGHR
ncbi:hypothetical protein [Saccharopolyspora taberi]|uniref:Uncharacterized protein n=1 Tax=Saccharopolyspora taberi TaxID=60895 RepID=A0ABN3V8E2_9PSEU